MTDAEMYETLWKQLPWTLRLKAVFSPSLKKCLVDQTTRRRDYAKRSAIARRTEHQF